MCGKGPNLIIKRLKRPEGRFFLNGILLGFGGQTALNCGTELAEKGRLFLSS